MRVTIVGSTTFHDTAAYEATDGDWSTPASEENSLRTDAALLSEFAGRECYQSWARPNPETATNEGYLRNIIAQQHWSVLEHGSVSLRIDGVSRSLTHELVRHRHFSYSQLSQRYVDVGAQQPVIPPLWRDGPPFIAVMLEAIWDAAIKTYQSLVEAAEAAGATHKQARQAARCVLPNMTPTSLVMTGNHRAWREMLAKRMSKHADAEMQELATEILRVLRDYEPGLYQDM